MESDRSPAFRSGLQTVGGKTDKMTKRLQEGRVVNDCIVHPEMLAE